MAIPLERPLQYFADNAYLEDGLAAAFGTTSPFR
jgi:hypothetical protein